MEAPYKAEKDAAWLSAELIRVNEQRDAEWREAQDEVERLRAQVEIAQEESRCYRSLWMKAFQERVALHDRIAILEKLLKERKNE